MLRTFQMPLVKRILLIKSMAATWAWLILVKGTFNFILSELNPLKTWLPRGVARSPYTPTCIKEALNTLLKIFKGKLQVVP